MSNSVRPHRQQPTRLPHSWDSPGKNTGVGRHFLLQCMKVKSESEVTQLYRILCDPMDCSLQAPLSMGFSRQEYWSGVPLLSLKLIQSYCQSLKAANDLFLSHTLTTHTHIHTHPHVLGVFQLPSAMDLTKSDSTLHKNLRGPRSVTHHLEISSGLHMSS